MIRERLLSKYPDDAPAFVKRRSEAHVTVRLRVIRQENEGAGYDNEKYDLVVTRAKVSPRQDHLDVDISSETYRYVE